MQRYFAFLLLLAIGAWCAKAEARDLQFDQAQKVALMVARHDNIIVDDRTVVLNSMDTRNERGFIPGYYSFSIIQESTTSAQPDKTLRVYIVSKRTADTWELNLCTHYSFPELERMQRMVMKETGAKPADEHEMPKAIGCENSVQAQATGNNTE
jgi:hypothetical protein